MNIKKKILMIAVGPVLEVPDDTSELPWKSSVS